MAHVDPPDAKLFADVVHAIDAGVYVWRLERPGDLSSFRLVAANPAAGRLTGRPPDEVLGKTMPEVFPASLGTRLPALYAEVIRTGEPRDVGEIRYGDERMPERTLRVRLFAVASDCVGVVFEDVSAHRRADLELRAREARFRALIENSAEAIALLGADGTIQYASPATTRILGYTVEEFLGLNVFELFRPEDNDFVRGRVLAALAQPRTPVEGHAFVRHRDGSWRFLEAVLTNLLDDPAVGAIVNNYRDATERRRAEDALRESEERFRLISAATSDALWDWDVVADRVWWSEGLQTLFGHDPSRMEPTRAGWSALLHPEDRERVVSGRDRLLEGDGAGWSDEYRWRRADGSYADVFDRAFVIRDANARAVRMVGATMDVSARKRADAALRQAHAFLEKAQEVARIGSWISEVGPEDPLIWSQGVHHIFGTDPATFDGRVATFFAMVHPDDVASVEAASRAAFEGGQPYRVDHRIVRPDRSVRWVHERADVERDAEGRPLRMIGIVQDITEQRELEDQLRQSQKMEAVGRLAGGIAHDFNNLLTAILGYTALLSRRENLDAASRRNLDEVRRAGERAAGLTRQLLAFSRKQVLVPEILDLNSLVTNLNEMLHRLIGEDIELSTILHRGPAWVRVDRSQIEQVVVNLVVNARDAMPRGGRLEVAVETELLDEAAARSHADAVPGRFAVLAVRDTGIGIDADIRNHVFEPFFTTKEVGKGTGLGLATVYGIVRQSGGFVTLESEPGVGTTFLVHLPSAREEISSKRPASVAPPAQSGHETVLLVEDEPLVREMTREVLETTGYHVLEASGGEEALRVSSQHAGPVHLLLTDVVMPGMSGKELARRLTELRPETAVLFASGYAEDAIAHHGVLDPGTAFIAKPFTPDTLAARVREVLDGKARG